MHTTPALAALGWHAFFQRQLREPEFEHGKPARIVSQQRSVLNAAGAGFECTLPVLASMPPLTVGDWVVLDDDFRFQRALERSSLFARKAAGTGRSTQLIAANVDTLFIVSSLNADFNLNRLERYLVLAREAGVQAVIVLTKEDLCAEPAPLLAQASTLGHGVLAVSVNALDRLSVAKLAPWCGPGQTVAVMGSSGVGKSTLVNTLLGTEVQATQAIRDDDAKGRHTTTQRALLQLDGGGLLLDTPGMRELQLTACEQGIDEVFGEITTLAAQCRFADCGHDNEPGCAVQQALKAGTIDERRLVNFRKLQREQARSDATPAELRARARAFGKLHRHGKSTHERKRKEGQED